MSNIRNILITGASNGIGSALAIRLANEESHLILLARNQEKLQQVSKQCRDLKAKVSIFLVDVTDVTTLQSTINAIDTETPIDLIICNAGVTNSVGKKGEAETWDEITAVVDTNFYGVLASLNPLISKMQQRKQGQIAIISSLTAFYGMPVTPIYSASKSALKGYGEGLRGWLKHDGIKVNMVYPGFVKSELSEQLKTDKPFMMSPQKAADIIVRGLEKNKASICFPFPLNFGIRILNMLPTRMADFFMGELFGAKKR